MHNKVCNIGILKNEPRISANDVVLDAVQTLIHPLVWQSHSQVFAGCMKDKDAKVLCLHFSRKSWLFFSECILENATRNLTVMFYYREGGDFAAGIFRRGILRVSNSREISHTIFRPLCEIYPLQNLAKFLCLAAA